MPLPFLLMEEIELPTESLHEEMHHQAEHAGQRERWISRVALSSALLAGMAAISALLSGHHANEALIEQLHSSDHWAHYQAKSLKAAILSSRASMLGALGRETPEADREKLKDYENEQKEIAEDAAKEEVASRRHLATHEVYARAVTFFQIAIAIGAISVLTRRQRFFWVSLAAGAVGLAFLVQGVLGL